MAKKKAQDKVKVYSTEPYAEEMLKMYMEEDTHNYDLLLEPGTTIQGILLGTIGGNIVVDIGYKDFVTVDGRPSEFIALQKAQKQSNDPVEVLITEVNEEPYMIKGSFSRLHKQAIVEDILTHNYEPLDAIVKEMTPAGYHVDLVYDGGKVAAFMPNTIAGINRLYNPQALVGQTFPVIVESYDEVKGTFIASRKKYLQSLIPTALENLQITNEAGEPIGYTGVVTGSTNYGIFVEFNNCLTGMIHRANLNEETLSSMETIKPGAKIAFFVKENVKGRLILTQVCRTTLWDVIKKDDVFTDAKVADMKKLGLLVQIDQETYGLIHVSELPKGKTYESGETITVKVSHVVRADRKIHLLLA